VKSQQGRLLENDSGFGDTTRIHEGRNQSDDESVPRCQIRSTLSRTIADDQLLLEKQRFRSDGSNTARAHHLRDGDDEMDEEDE